MFALSVRTNPNEEHNSTASRTSNTESYGNCWIELAIASHSLWNLPHTHIHMTGTFWLNSQIILGKSNLLAAHKFVFSNTFSSGCYHLVSSLQIHTHTHSSLYIYGNQKNPFHKMFHSFSSIHFMPISIIIITIKFIPITFSNR